MMNNALFEKNIKAIGDRWPEYSELFKERNEESGICCEINEIEGRYIPVVHKDGRDYQLSSLYSDEKILERWGDFVNQQLFDSVIFLFGLGTGMYVRYLLERVDKENGKKISIFVYEPDTTILGKLIYYYDFTDIICDERVTVAIGTADDDALKNWTRKTINYNNVRNTGSGYYLNYPKIYKEERTKYDDELDYLIGDYYSNINVHKFSGEARYLNKIKNVHKFAESRSVSSLMERFNADIPVFLVSSGPSLSKNISELKRAKGKSLIIAMDSSLGVFDKARIIPDMYVTIDPGKSKDCFSFPWVKDVPAMSLMASPEYAVCEEQVYYMICLYDSYIMPFLKECGEDKLYNAVITGGGSVANNAFTLAMAMGAKKVIFVGQDLAFTGDKIHALEVSASDGEMVNVMETIDIHGEPIRSSRQFIAYKKWFEDAIKSIDGLTAIDATEGGAYIEGTEVMNLREAIDKFCTKEHDVQEILSGTEGLFDDEEKYRYYDLMSKIPEKTDEVIHDARKLVSNYEKMEKTILNGKATGDRLRKLLATGNDLSARIEENSVYSYVGMVNSDSEINVEENVNSINPDKEKDLLSMCRLGREHAENIIKAAGRVKRDYSALKLEQSNEGMEG